MSHKPGVMFFMFECEAKLVWPCEGFLAIACHWALGQRGRESGDCCELCRLQCIFNGIP